MSDRTCTPKEVAGRGTACRFAACRLQPAAPLKEALHFPFQFRKGGFDRLAPGIDDNRPLWTQMLEMETYGFAHTSPDAVAHHGFSDRARERKPDPRPARLCFSNAKGGKQRSRKTGTPIVDSAEIRGSQQTNTFRETRDTLPLGADREFVAAPSPASRQDRPPVLGFHAGAEPVCLRAPPIVRLKGTFRHLIPNYSV